MPKAPTMLRHEEAIRRNAVECDCNKTSKSVGTVGLIFSLRMC